MRGRLEAADLHAITDPEACAFVDAKFGPGSAWHSPLIRYRFTSDFQEHWKNEVGHWLWTADSNGFLPRCLDRMLTRANQSSQAARDKKADDALYTVLLQELAPLMVAHYLLGTGLQFVDWDQQPAAGQDVDLVLHAQDKRLIDVQVKAPSQPTFLTDAERDGVVCRRIDQASPQLPRPARNASLIVICADRLWGLAGEPSPVIQHVIGRTTGYGLELLLLERLHRGRFFDAAWSHVGGVMLLDYRAGISTEEGREMFIYSTTVILNPQADPPARLEREWFPRARVLWLDSTTFRWDGEAPARCGLPSGTILADD